jgi:hypothetical protein
MKPVGRVQYLLTSSACTYVSVKGSNSAVGTAVRKLYDRSYVDATSASHTSDVDPRQGRQRIKSSPGENWKLEFLLCPRNEAFQVRFANTSNRVDVRYKRPRYTIGTKNEGKT